MPITVNGEQKDWREGLTLAELMEDLRFTFPLKIVAINGQGVPRDAYETTILRDGDQVQVIHMMSGG